MNISKDTFLYICKRQVELDAAFSKKSKWVPALQDRRVALAIEKGEFANEYPEAVKWWKHASNKEERIIDEYVDLLHFLAGIVVEKTHSDMQINSVYDSMMKKHIGFISKFKPERMNDAFDLLFREHDDVEKSVVIATYILSRTKRENGEYFTDADIRAAYDAKNAENFERIAAGY